MFVLNGHNAKAQQSLNGYTYQVIHSVYQQDNLAQQIRVLDGEDFVLGLETDTIGFTPFGRSENETCQVEKIQLIKHQEPTQNIAISIVMDYSGSMIEDHRLEEMVNGVCAFMDSLQHIYFTRVNFDSYPHVLSPMAKKDIRRPTVNEYDQYGAGTALYDAIAAGVSTVKNFTGKRYVLAFTDGDDTESQWMFEGVTAYALEHDVHVIGIVLNMNDYVIIDPLKTICYETNPNTDSSIVFYDVHQSNELASRLKKFQKDLFTSYYAVDYHCPSIELTKDPNDKQLDSLALLKLEESNDSLNLLRQYFVYFEHNTYTMSAGQVSLLDSVLQSMIAEFEEASMDTLYITGHSSPDGFSSHNLSLSKARAQTVKEFIHSNFVKNNYEPHSIQSLMARIKLDFKGDNAYIYAADSPDYDLNRRVEIVLN